MKLSVRKSFNPTILTVIFAAFACVRCASEPSFAGQNNGDPSSPLPGISNDLNPVINQIPSPTPDAIVPPPEAIVQGSFTVWPVPLVPMEGQPYAIHILVKLPSNTGSYNQTDLSGTLTGTDGYSQAINGMATSPNMFFPLPGRQTFNFTPGANQAELIMFIPGAQRGINDQIQVRSNLINESQSISVTFN